MKKEQSVKQDSYPRPDGSPYDGSNPEKKTKAASGKSRASAQNPTDSVLISPVMPPDSPASTVPKAQKAKHRKAADAGTDGTL
ncbi:MAG: hypothetical protein MJ078_02110 [Clostridia bacterium]|nr:hypothetical protein [Clostridia bacterium]